MLHSHIPQSQTSHVTVEFCDGADSFLLAAGTTLTELASRICALGSQHDGAPISIEIQFKTGVKATAKSHALHEH